MLSFFFELLGAPCRCCYIYFPTVFSSRRVVEALPPSRTDGNNRPKWGNQPPPKLLGNSFGDPPLPLVEKSTARHDGSLIRRCCCMQRKTCMQEQ